MDNLTDIRLFLDATNLGSFSAAGRKHGVSPAAASACIQRMEAALGARLFERTTRQLRLTEEGQLYRDYCQQALDLLTEAEQQLQAGQQLVQGMVRISAPSDLGRNLLMRFLDEFHQLYPNVRFALQLSDSQANLVGDDIDLAIRYGQPRDSTLVARPLAPNRRVVIVAPDAVERLGRPATPQALAQLPCLVLVTAAGPMNDWGYAQDGVLQSVRLTRYQESNDGEIIRKWAIQGAGYARKSLLDVADDLREGRLQTVLDDYFIESTPLNALYQQGRFQPPRVRLLIEFLQARFETVVSELRQQGLLP
ncbi:LysR family transcriptional regulator [Chitinivorax sp. B]|uniref:LysR family transcriptional regulator n=1 Tax=Chitinivorax sp. B TaxID=2502235 RepID=UPI0010F7456C|nr:LysR family transcriptional regulator [Chitinivorax sp. B]